MNPEYEVLRTAIVELCDDWEEWQKGKVGTEDEIINSTRVAYIQRLRYEVAKIDKKTAVETPDHNPDLGDKVVRQADTIKLYQETLVAHHAVCPIASSVSLVNVLANEVNALMESERRANVDEYDAMSEAF